MTVKVLSCAEVEERHLEAAYIAGRLAADDAAAYELHYFGCERCWPSLKRATEAREALALPRSGARWWPWGLAAAATVILATSAVLLARRDAGEQAVVRGDGDSLSLTAAVAGDSVASRWSGAPGAIGYRVRLHRADGTLVLEHETTDTAFAAAGSALAAPDSAVLFWQVQALDRTRQVIARSALVPARPPVPDQPQLPAQPQPQ